MNQPLIAVCIASEQGGTLIENEVLITSYKEAVEYYLQYSENPEFSIEFLLFDDCEDLEQVLSDIALYYSDYIDYFWIEDAQEYFGIEVPTYIDGTEIAIGDKFTVLADYFFWGAVFDHSKIYSGTVKRLATNHTIEIVLDHSPEHRLEIEHYKIKKVNNEN